MIGCCSKCGKLFESTAEDALAPGATCAPCYNWGACVDAAGACVDAAGAHVDAAGGEDSPTYTALQQRVLLWLRSKGMPADPESVRAEAATFVLALWAW